MNGKNSMEVSEDRDIESELLEENLRSEWN